ncbi:MAG: hypothetical protein AAF570_00720 [Bacteroidota bacterium]
MNKPNPEKSPIMWRLALWSIVVLGLFFVFYWLFWPVTGLLVREVDVHIYEHYALADGGVISAQTEWVKGGDREMYVLRMDAEGEEVWKHKFEWDHRKTLFRNSPGLSEDRIAVVLSQNSNREYYLEGLDMATGEQKWEMRADGPQDYEEFMQAIWRDGRIGLQFRTGVGEEEKGIVHWHLVETGELVGEQKLGTYGTVRVVNYEAGLVGQSWDFDTLVFWKATNPNIPVKIPGRVSRQMEAGMVAWKDDTTTWLDGRTGEIRPIIDTEEAPRRIGLTDYVLQRPNHIFFVSEKFNRYLLLLTFDKSGVLRRERLDNSQLEGLKYYNYRKEDFYGSHLYQDTVPRFMPMKYMHDGKDTIRFPGHSPIPPHKMTQAMGLGLAMVDTETARVQWHGFLANFTDLKPLAIRKNIVIVLERGRGGLTRLIVLDGNTGKLRKVISVSSTGSFLQPHHVSDNRLWLSDFERLHALSLPEMKMVVGGEKVKMVDETAKFAKEISLPDQFIYR